MRWVRENSGWVASAVGTMLIIAGFMSGIFGTFIEKETKPVVEEVVETELQMHVLEVEPRLQAIEATGDHNRQEIDKINGKVDESLMIQRQILAEVKKD